jgi:hypothetical protein
VFGVWRVGWEKLIKEGLGELLFVALGAPASCPHQSSEGVGADYDFLVDSHPDLAELACGCARPSLRANPLPYLRVRPGLRDPRGADRLDIPGRPPLSRWPGSVGAMCIEDEAVPR